MLCNGESSHLAACPREGYNTAACLGGEPLPGVRRVHLRGKQQHLINMSNSVVQPGSSKETTHGTLHQGT